MTFTSFHVRYCSLVNHTNWILNQTREHVFTWVDILAFAAVTDCSTPEDSEDYSWCIWRQLWMQLWRQLVFVIVCQTSSFVRYQTWCERSTLFSFGRCVVFIKQNAGFGNVKYRLVSVIIWSSLCLPCYGFIDFVCVILYGGVDDFGFMVAFSTWKNCNGLSDLNLNEF